MLTHPINRWWNVVAGAFGSGLGAGLIVNYSFGILGQNMIRDFGWDRSAVTTMISAFMLGSGIGCLALGWLITRYGIRLPTAVMVGVWGLCFASVSILPPSQSLLTSIFLLAGIAGAAATAMPYSVAVSGFFDSRRGLALGLVVAGSGVGTLVFPQITQALVENFGWRLSFAIIGMIAAVVPVAGLMFLVRTPTGVTTSRVPEEGTAKGLDWIVQTCLRSRHFWFIGASLLAVSIATMGAIASYVFLFADLHISSRTIAAILSISGLASLIGRMIVGYLLDRFFAPYVTACVFGFAAAGLAVLALAPSTPTAFVAASLIGIALGAEADILAFLVSRYFKVGDFSRVLGILWVAWAWGGAIGSVIMGKGYATTGSYTIPLAFLTFLIALGAIIICFIGPYRFPVHSVKKAGIEG